MVDVDETEFSYQVVPASTVWLLIVIPFYVAAAIAIVLCWRSTQPTTNLEATKAGRQPPQEQQATVRVSRALAAAAPLVALQLVISGLHSLGLLQSFPSGEIGWYFGLAYAACMSQAVAFLALVFFRQSRIPSRLVQLTLLANCFLFAAAYSTTVAAEIHQVSGLIARNHPNGAPDEPQIDADRTQQEQAQLRRRVEHSLRRQTLQLHHVQDEFAKRSEALRQLRRAQSKRQFERVDALQAIEKQRDEMHASWTHDTGLLISHFVSTMARADQQLERRELGAWSTGIVPPGTEILDNLERVVAPATLDVSFADQVALTRLVAQRTSIDRLSQRHDHLARELRRIDEQLGAWDHWTDELSQIDWMFDRCEDGLDTLGYLGFAQAPAAEHDSVDWTALEMPPAAPADQNVIGDGSSKPGKRDLGESSSTGSAADRHRIDVLSAVGRELKGWRALAESLDESLQELETDAHRFESAAAESEWDEPSDAPVDGDTKVNRNKWLMTGFYALWACCMVCSTVTARNLREESEPKHATLASPSPKS